MAFALKGAGSNTSSFSATANQSTFVLTTVTTAGSAGDLAVMLYAVDNNQTTDGDENAVTGITDSAGNVWTKAVEFTNGQGSAQAGATCGIWYCNLGAALAIGATITLAFSNNASRDAVAVSLTYFTKAAGQNAAVEGTSGTLANDAAAAGSLNVTTANIACLRIRAIASESSTATVLTKTAAFTAVLTQALTTGGATAANMGIRGEYLISTSTGQASAPTGGAGAVDNASVYVAFKEISSDLNVNVTGVTGTGVARGAEETVIPGVTGVSGTGVARDIAVRGDDDVGITGVAGIGVAGTITADTGAVNGSGNLSGAAGTGTAGVIGRAVDKGLTGAAGIGTAGTDTPAVDKALTGVTGTGTAGIIASLVPEGVTGVAGIGVANSISVSVAAFLAQAVCTGTAGTIAFVADGSANANLTGASGIGLAGTLTGADSAFITGAIGAGLAGTILGADSAFLLGVTGTGVARAISGADAEGFLGVTGTGLARGISASEPLGIFGVAGIGVARAITVALSGGTVTASPTQAAGTGVAGTIVGLSSTAAVAVAGGNGGTAKPTTFLRVKRKGDLTEILEERAREAKRKRKKKPKQPQIEPVVAAVPALPPVLLDILKGAVAPAPVEYEDDENAITAMLERHIEHESEVRSAIADVATEIISSLIQEIIEELETETT